MLSGLENPLHWVVVLVIALVLFGPKRLPELGRSLGAGIRGFKEALGDESPAEGDVSKEQLAERGGAPSERRASPGS